jgi:hypothetical protein
MIIVKGGWMDWGESTSLTFKINNVIWMFEQAIGY